MKPICFIYDLDEHSKQHTRNLIDALVDPVLIHLPNARKVAKPRADAINVRFWWDATFSDDVFFFHGISDKNIRNGPDLEQFGTIFHSGPRWERRYRIQGVPDSKTRQVGYTKLDPLVDMPQQRHIVLWAPTWAIKWEAGYRHLAGILNRSDIEWSRHCLDQPNAVTLSQLVDADVVIGDGGSTIYEAWALGKPVVFPDFAVVNSGLLSPGSMEAEIYERQVGYHVHDPKDLERVIDLARSNGITSAERDFIDDVFPPELRGTSGKAHAEALMELAT